MNHFKTVTLLGLLSGLLIAVSYAIGGTTGAFFGVVLAAITNFGSWYYSDRIALTAYGAKPVSPAQAPELAMMVQTLSDRAGLPMPALYIVPSQSANAFATGRDPDHAAVAVTQGLISLLPADELEAVIAHELSHIQNRDTLTQAVAATIAGGISFLAQMAFWFIPIGRGDNGRNPLVGLLMLIVAPVAATVIQLGISRTREFAADAGAAQLTGNPRALARALQRLDQNARQLPINGNPAFEPLLIMNGFSGQKFTSKLFSTHPATEARIERLLQLEGK
ncbi:MAG: M48 family metalloprotease [Chroococcales cyanobacterium]